ncbi:MAG TPA: glycosyltransferase, partial [Myxococcota bacterium]|nr:glycosyltransferase [Myxococcota bacterium]
PAVTDLLANADLMLAPSRLETCGLAVMEAMAVGCPIVANDLPTHREVAGEAALYVDDASSMVEAATTVLSSPSLWARLSAAGARLLPDRAAVVAQWLHFWEHIR